MARMIRFISRLEDAILVAILVALIALAGGQILLRNLFELGFLWIEPLSRILVMWLALIAAGIATREKSHLSIDLTQSLPSSLVAWFDRLVNLCASGICLAIAYFSIELVQFEYEDGFMAFDGLPVWLTQVVIPGSFLVMGLRFLLHAIVKRKPGESS